MIYERIRIRGRQNRLEGIMGHVVGISDHYHMRISLIHTSQGRLELWRIRLMVLDKWLSSHGFLSTIVFVPCMGSWCINEEKWSIGNHQLHCMVLNFPWYFSIVLTKWTNMC